MKILWMSNSPGAGTGYGVQTKIFTPMITKAGHDVIIFAFYGREGYPVMNNDGIMELPRLAHLYGHDVVVQHYETFNREVLFSLIDPFALDPKVMAKMQWAAWCPVDSLPEKHGNVTSLQASRWQIAMSRFGEERLKEAGFENVMYCPHGINTKEYAPMDRGKAREDLAEQINTTLDGKFVVVAVAANKGRPGRKNFDGLMMAFAEFAKAHEDAVLYIHSDAVGIFQGEDLTRMAAAYGIKDKVFFPNQYLYMMGFIQPEYLNKVYNAADVMVNISYGEGFGIPIVEAQAAGCPVIVTDATAMSELCFSGQKVTAIPIHAGTEGSHQFLALHPMVVQAMEWAYSEKDNAKVREAARAGALAYDADKVFREYMLPVLEKIDRDIHKRPSVQEMRERRKEIRRRKQQLTEATAAV